MKPDKNICVNCGERISGRAKYCSDRCRKQFTRNPDKKGVKVGQNQDKTQPGHANPDKPGQLTKTDQTFYDRAMRDFGEPYYSFGGETHEEVCLFCGDSFTTTLNMLRFCSYEHYSKSLSGGK